jgi:hypothetical protein
MENIKIKIGLSILAITIIGGLIVACGGGSSSPTATTINGIAVPPEPDTTLNNATLAGVDSNNNGVRDDVERKIASVATNQAYFDVSIGAAKEYQDVLLANNPTSDQVNEQIKKAICLIINSNGLVKNEREVRDYIADNDARKAAMKKNLIKAGGFLSGECSE